jgi:hypothetical protein
MTCAHEGPVALLLLLKLVVTSGVVGGSTQAHSAGTEMATLWLPDGMPVALHARVT